jgi:ferrous iron transport protein B
MRIALVGQPNCGKSTLFNSVAGYKAVVSNFPGTTIEFTRSHVSLDGESFELVDLPGIYSLSSPETEEIVARDYLLRLKPDAVINIMDASILCRSLELTLELLELKVPLVICLNMIDEAERKGIQIDVQHLEQDLGIPIIPTIASRGQRVSELFQAAVKVAKSGKTGKTFLLSRDVETEVAELASQIKVDTAQGMGLPVRLLALKLLEQDDALERKIGEMEPGILPVIERLRGKISKSHGRPSDVVLSSERHSLAMNLFEHVTQVKPRTKKMLRDQVDKYIMHPYWGYLILVLILFAFFNLVFNFGKLIEEPLMGWFEQLTGFLGAHLDQESVLFTTLNGLIQGFSGGIGIVLPYLVPFLLGLSLLEDLGYLPRAAFLMDTIMHRIGLHGKAIIPFVLGYGCNVPAIMGVKILDSPRDRFISAVLVTFVPCAARTTIIFGLVAFYLGPNLALFLYILNILVIAAAGKFLSRMMPEVSPGMILEIPSYKLPSSRAVANKIWFRLREFIIIAWPLLILGSIILSLLEYFQLSGAINRMLSPFTSGLLGLPEEVSITLIFGILRKELTIIMLIQALGTSDFASVMTSGQMMIFTVFTLFYIPCLATLAILRSVIGTRGMIFTLAFTTAVATLIALIFRIVFYLFL